MSSDIAERLKSSADEHRGDMSFRHRAEMREGAAEIERLTAEIERLRAASQWKPIETAPKGVVSLLWRKSGIEIGDWQSWCIYNQPKFTHWQPLPSPPTQEGGG